MRRPWTTLPLLLVLLACGLRAARAGDDDLAAARAEARTALIAEAEAALEREGRSAIAAIRRALADDARFAAGHEPADAEARARLEAFRASIEERRRFVGRGAEGDVPEVPGALHQARALGAWLTGSEPCAVRVVTPDGQVHAYAYPPEDAPAPAAAEEPAAPAGDAPAEPSAPGGEAPTPAEPPQPTATEAAAPRTPEERAMDWARDVRRREGGSLLGRVITPEPCAELDQLEALAARPPAAQPEDGLRLRRHALAGENVLGYNAPSTLLRLLQAQERAAAMQQDRPQPTLVDAAMVREKAEIAAQARTHADRVADLRRALLAELDAMVEDLDAWKTQAALVAADIETLRRALGTAGDGAPEDEAEVRRREAASLPLRLAQARESLVTLEITLLYHTAQRASVRLGLLDRLARAAAQELNGAQEVRELYDEALLRLRSSRRLDRLASHRSRLLRWIDDAERAPPAAGSVEARRLAAYRALLACTDVVREAVARRQAMAAASTAPRASPPGGPEAATPAGDEKLGPRLSPHVLDPERATWDVRYIELATQELEDPDLQHAFDARLVAEHYAVAGEHVRALARAAQAGREPADLRARFTDARRAAAAALAALEDDVLTTVVRRLPTSLAALEEDFDAALAGIAEQRARNEQRLAALDAYQRTLASQGTRSLLIRIDRSRRDPVFRDLVRDARAAVGTAGAWATFQGEDHAGTWVGRRWVRILLVLLALAAAWVLARLGRHWVDGRIQAMVARFPAVSASVAEERERARVRREQADRAAQEISADDVIQTSPGERPAEVVEAIEVTDLVDADEARRDAAEAAATDDVDDIDDEHPEARP